MSVVLARPRVYRPTPANLARLAAVLRRGGLVGVPSETVYGLAADAFSAGACAGIFEAKGRPGTDPLIVHLAGAGDLGEVAEPNEDARRLAAAFWPGPLTLVLPKRERVPGIVTAGRPTVAVRVPAQVHFRRLIRLCGRPLAAPSANPFGYISPTTAAHVRDGLAGTALRAVLDGGECPVGVESTIVDLTRPERPVLLRPGGLAAEEIERVLGRSLAAPRRSRLAVGVAAPAPGMLTRHYSPRTPLTLHERLVPALWQKPPAGEGVLLARRPSGVATEFVRTGRVRWLSESGDLAEVARRLFGVLRQMDAAGWRRIHVEKVVGEDGLAPAIRDRLTRAAARSEA